MDLHTLDTRSLTEADCHREFNLRQVAASRHHLAAKNAVAEVDLDHGADGIAVVECTHQFEAEIVSATIQLIAQEERRTAVLRQDQVEIAVAIDIGICGAATNDNKMSPFSTIS